MAAYEPLVADGTAKAVANNVRAMERAISLGVRDRDFTVSDLLDIHRVLLEGTSESRFPGIIRADQNWIGGRGASPADAAYIYVTDFERAGIPAASTREASAEDVAGACGI